MDPTRYFPGLSAGFGPRTIFLDFDGVLNTDEICEQSGRSHSHPLFSPQQHLSTELVTAVHEVVQSTDAQVVISSTWRRTYDVRCLRAFLWGCGFRETDRIVGVTPRLKGLPRSEEIAAWLRDRGSARPKSFAIVDDDPGACPREYARERFVECNPFVGFDTAASLRCTALLLAELEMKSAFLGDIVLLRFNGGKTDQLSLIICIKHSCVIDPRGLHYESTAYKRISLADAAYKGTGISPQLNITPTMVILWSKDE